VGWSWGWRPARLVDPTVVNQLERRCRAGRRADVAPSTIVSAHPDWLDPLELLFTGWR